MTEYRFNNVSLKRGGRQILNDVSGVLQPGRVTAILGANGAGKSSLLTCLTGLRVPDAGEIMLGDQAVAALGRRERAQLIGLLPQRGDVHWDVDVHTLVALGRLPHCGRGGMSAHDHAAVARAMAATDCARLADRPVHQLSGGEQSRVLLARVLAGEPRWLFADEPLAGLDPAHQLDVLDRLRASAQEGAGAIVVLHDLTLAARVADHILLLKAGQVIAQGSRDEVLTPDLLAKAYDVDVHISLAAHGEMLISPLKRRI